MTGKPPAKKSSQDGQLSETREAMKSNNPEYALDIYLFIISCERDFAPTEDRTGRQLVEDLCSVV